MRIKGFRFPKDVILLRVRWYHRYNLSYRDLEEMLQERGVGLDHSTVYRCDPLYAVSAFGLSGEKKRIGGRCRMDETYVKVSGHDHAVSAEITTRLQPGFAWFYAEG